MSSLSRKSLRGRWQATVCVIAFKWYWRVVSGAKWPFRGLAGDVLVVVGVSSDSLLCGRALATAGYYHHLEYDVVRGTLIVPS
jgi:hypothetical protein